MKNIANRVSIHQRPQEVENRQEAGHWEMDLIQNGKEFIVTLVERKEKDIKRCFNRAKIMNIHLRQSLCCLTCSACHKLFFHTANT